VLADDGQLSFDDPVSEHLSESLLDGTDYTK
jgi:CubicO group peptidase (beta-lactamase class C family)